MRILFVDDSKVTRAIMGQLLRFHGHEVFIAADADEAKHLLGEESFGMIITDLNMPGTDGLALSRWIRQRSGLKRLPVLLLTADFDTAAKAEAEKAGVDLFIEKTFSPEKMAEAIQKAADGFERQGGEKREASP